MNFDNFLSKVDEKAPEILFGVGCVGIFTTVISTVFATKKMTLKIDEINEQKLEPKEKKIAIAKETAKTCWPIALNMAITLYCFGASRKIEHDRLVSTAAALAVSTDSLKKIKDKTKEIVGEANAKKINDAVAEEKLKTIQPNAHVYETGTGSYLCMDSFTGRLFRSDIDSLEKIRATLNNRFHNEMFISFNDLWYELGIPACDSGNDNGWDVNKRNSITFDYTYGPSPITSEPILILSYDVDSRYNYGSLI